MKVTFFLTLLVDVWLFHLFESFRVRFEPYPGRLVHAHASKEVDFCENGPMDRKSVKSCATVAHMRQKLNKSCSNDLSQVASQADRRTGYGLAKRTKLMSNHTMSGGAGGAVGSGADA